MTTAVTHDHLHELAFELTREVAPPYTPPKIPGGAWAASVPWMQRKLHKFAGTSAERAAHALFHRERSAIFVELRRGRVYRFVPFANREFVNDWPEPPREALERHFDAKWARMGRREDVLPFSRWWCAEHLLCNVLSPQTISSKSQLAVRDMLHAVCSERAVPDCAFFVNPRDGPLLRRDGQRSCPPPWRPHGPALAALHDMLPVFSFYSSPRHFDCPCPTACDWLAATQRGGLGRDPPPPPDRSAAFEDKAPAAVWRGSLTGPGRDARANMRIALVQRAPSWRLDVRATGTNHERCRVCPATGAVVSVDPRQFAASRRNYMPFDEQQRRYRYTLVLPGHGGADRWPRALGGNQVALRAEPTAEMWFDHALRPGEHYVALRGDPERAVDELERDAPAAAAIARAARAFHDARLTRAGILDWWAAALFSLPPTCKLGRDVPPPCPALEGYKDS